ncbi:MAG: DUF3592 domain-containing protein [Pseudomonadota bacterium]|nr:DUF3592 domain-containing protein [Pseudomonadota bacterium]
MIVRKDVPIDWPLLIAALREEIGWFVLLVVMGFVFGGVGVLVAISYENWLDFGALLIGGIFLLCGIALLVAAFIGPVSSVGYHYHQGLLGKHGVNVDAVLTKKEVQCQFHQDYDHNNNPLGEGYLYCDLLVEFDFQFNGSNYSGAYYLGKAGLFDKLRGGDLLPLKVLRLDPSVYKVRERRLANILKGREPEHPSQIPVGAEISQQV